ncbi:mucin-5AC-like isoform X2 [Branchiostoma floridae]|uniref:Mucin-5AC-like isoform X2 n=1 Tax=Branchiostoma floridae TaxID=7739 RepID=A0A9J7N902_BRAFL|nr:mucin-5AC-like isoform X2 [Branchiostoma floridae]
MAEASPEGEVDRSLETNIFDCSICLQIFTRPKVLPCGHTFCKNCLVTYVNGDWSFKCPTCMTSVYLAKKGVEGVERLTDNISLGNLRDDFASLTIINKQRSKVEGSIQQSNQQVCARHNDMEVKYYCPSCEEVICGECIVDEHNTHGVTRLVKALEKQAEQAREVMDEGRSWIDKVRGKITETEEAMMMLKLDEDVQSDSVDERAARLKEVLTQAVDKRASDLKKELSALFELKRFALTNRKEELETALATLLNCVEEIERCIASEETIALIRGRKVLQEVIQPLPEKTLLMDEQDSLLVFTPSPFDMPIISLGTVRRTKNACASPSKMGVFSFGKIHSTITFSASPINLPTRSLTTDQNATNSSASTSCFNLPTPTLTTVQSAPNSSTSTSPLNVPSCSLATVQQSPNASTSNVTSPINLPTRSLTTDQNAPNSSTTTSSPNVPSLCFTTVQNTPNSSTCSASTSTSPINVPAWSLRMVESDIWTRGTPKFSSKTVQRVRKPVVRKSSETTHAVDAFVKSLQQRSEEQHLLDPTFPKMCPERPRVTSVGAECAGNDVSQARPTNSGTGSHQDIVQVLLREPQSSTGVKWQPSSNPNHSSAAGTNTLPQSAPMERTGQQQLPIFKAQQQQGPRRYLHVKRNTKKVNKVKDTVAKNFKFEIPHRDDASGGGNIDPSSSESTVVDNPQTNSMPTDAEGSVKDTSTSAEESTPQGAAALSDGTNAKSSDLDV